jgi:hypothetical protein
MSLALFTSVLEGVEQLRIKTCQASQILGVYLVGLALVGIDQPCLARIGYQHLVATLFEHPANPGRVSARLDGDSQRLLRREAAPESFGGGTQPALFDHLTAFSVSRRQR